MHRGTGVGADWTPACAHGGALELRDEIEHVLDAGGLREAVTGRVDFAIGALLGDLKDLDLAIDDVDGGALAPLRVEAERIVGALARAVRFALARQHDAERLGQGRLRVGDELDQFRGREALILFPALHHRAVVDAEDVDLLDPRRLKPAVNFGLLESRDLASRSGRRERTRERYEKHLMFTLRAASRTCQCRSRRAPSLAAPRARSQG